MSLSSPLLQRTNMRNCMTTAKTQARKNFAKGLLLASLLTSVQAGGFIPDNHTASTLHSLGVGVEFLNTLQTNAILQSTSTDTRWTRFVQQFDASYEFIPIIRSMIVQAGIPQEFLFLAMAESGFSSRAYSKKRAVGIWQFMPYTAKDLGLVINDYIDERRDPIKSTQAAIKYLQFLYNATGEWYLAAMAYNCGLGRLKKAIERAGSSKLEVLLDEQEKYLPGETRQYIRTILSMSLAFSNTQKMQSVNREYLLNRGAFDTLAQVQVKGGTLLASIAASAGMSLADIKKYNRHLTYNFLPQSSKQYAIYIPYDRLAYFKQNFNPHTVATANFIFHKVKKGESLASIAKKYGISMEELKLSNNFSSKQTIFANQKIIIPILQKITQN
ncbi:lytic transglycosylase domain-containing protein [Helicobacter sp.]|uniref:lytic transglycosylase domain-containing protein n=1 Tax=Helicobacter sp. TaxID=218 RepID=UPI0025B835D0|nr:lytic transglycosylase domain-containing protein [Helicobacter sp.]MBR2494084.1 transglycosylase SLT domain-containing protein [Helicobacter sp.]